MKISCTPADKIELLKISKKIHDSSLDISKYDSLNSLAHIYTRHETIEMANGFEITADTEAEKADIVKMSNYLKNNDIDYGSNLYNAIIRMTSESIKVYQTRF